MNLGPLVGRHIEHEPMRAARGDKLASRFIQRTTDAARRPRRVARDILQIGEFQDRVKENIAQPRDGALAVLGYKEHWIEIQMRSVPQRTLNATNSITFVGECFVK